MDLPDCPPGAEGYQDSVVEIPKKPDAEDSPKCTKAEQEFQDHLNSLKIRLENGETRCMVERRGRDISGKWIYLCYPCGSVCSGESILQMHISGKKHKVKLSMRNSWPVSIFDDHPFNQNQKGQQVPNTATENVLKKMAAEVVIHKQPASELENKYKKFRNDTCHIQDALDELTTPLLGVEYLLEHPPEKAHYEPSYICTLCTKQGHPRTIINHLTCFWHRYNYLLRHFPKACKRLGPYKNVNKYREGVSCIMHRLAQRIEDNFGRLKPIHIDKDEYEKDKEAILQWIFKSQHFSENSGITLEEVVDLDLLESLAKSGEETKKNMANAIIAKKKDPSPPVVAAPSKPQYNARQARKERRVSMESLSDISDDDIKRVTEPRQKWDARANRERHERKAHAAPESFRARTRIATPPEDREEKYPHRQRPVNQEYKLKLVSEKCAAATESAATMLAYHEKNPEKHPLYPEEWKKFWNRRYKEIQAEGKDPSKHDFKPEWIVFWTKRMKELHEEELNKQVSEVFRRMNFPPPDLKLAKQDPSKQEKKPIEPKGKLSEPMRSAESRKRAQEPRRRSPEPRKRSPVWEHSRRRSPEDRGRDVRRRSSERRRSPGGRRHSPDYRHRSPPRRSDYRHNRLVTPNRYVVDHRQHKMDVHHSPPPAKRTRSRSPVPRRRSPYGTHILLESARRSRSPLSRRDSELRNRSPGPPLRRDLDPPHRNRSPAPHHTAPTPTRELAPSLQTVLISDDELKADESPWNSDNEVGSVKSMPQSHAGSMVSSHMSTSRRYMGSFRNTHETHDLGPAENIVATLRVLVALEDYLGSLGPKMMDLLTEALTMEKERANSSEELLERESAVVLIETAKEKLKGAAQAGLVPAAAAPALRAAIVRAAATLHEADTRVRKKQANNKKMAPANAKPVPVAGVGEVDRAQIAQQMAAALIAQGKTDVTSEELAQLVDAVVGMAEAKKREAEASKVEPKPASPSVVKPPAAAPSTSAPVAKLSGTATALQMLQSAYDENDKKLEKDDAIDAMDGLSDSDLETLLKNFNELSAEEQHSLIAYLKKLEAREPQRVERLRQYVSAAANSAKPAAATETPVVQETKPVTIESDDDDYTVEEVFQSATKKVKEDQIRKELDIVKKSLESKEKDEAAPKQIKTVPIVDLSKHLSSASDLFALVQASIRSTATVSAAPKTQTVEVVSSTLPRSFGDKPEPMKQQNSSSTPIPASSQDSQFDMQDEPMNPPNNENYQNDDFNQNEPYDHDQQWNERQMNNTSDYRGSPSMHDQGFNNYTDGGQPQYQDSEPVDQFRPGPNSGMNEFGQGNNSGPNQFGQGSNSGPNQFGQGNNSGPNQFGQGSKSGPNQFGQGNNSGPNQFGQGSNSGPNKFGQGNNSGPNQFGQGLKSGPNQFGQGPISGQNQSDQQPNSRQHQFDQRSNSGSNKFGPNSGPIQFGQGPNQFGQAPNQPNQRPNLLGQGPNQSGQGPNQFGQDNNEWQGIQGQNENWQAPNQYNPGPTPHNQGPRGNMNGRMGNNFGNRPQPFNNMNQQQFGINQNRGRGGGGGRGHFGGRGRGRGRF